MLPNKQKPHTYSITSRSPFGPLYFVNRCSSTTTAANIQSRLTFALAHRTMFLESLNTHRHRGKIVKHRRRTQSQRISSAKFQCHMVERTNGSHESLRSQSTDHFPLSCAGKTNEKRSIRIIWVQWKPGAPHPTYLEYIPNNVRLQLTPELGHRRLALFHPPTVVC